MTVESLDGSCLPLSQLDFEAIRRTFVQKGYVVLHDLLPPSHVELLRKECARRLSWETSLQSLVRKSGCILESVPGAPSTCKRDASLYGDMRRKLGLEPTVNQLILHDIPLLVSRLLGTESNSIHLLNEQYIVKPPNSGGKTAFRWHQDAETMPENLRNAPYMSVWCALDDMNEEVGTLCVPQTKTKILNSQEEYGSLVATVMTNCGQGNNIMTFEGRNDVDKRWAWAESVTSQQWAGAERPEECEEFEECGDGDNFEHALLMNAGSVVVLHPLFWHRSCPNISNRVRRAYMPQYSVGEVVTDDGEPVVLAVPCNGQ